MKSLLHNLKIYGCFVVFGGGGDDVFLVVVCCSCMFLFFFVVGLFLEAFISIYFDLLFKTNCIIKLCLYYLQCEFATGCCNSMFIASCF